MRPASSQVWAGLAAALGLVVVAWVLVVLWITRDLVSDTDAGPTGKAFDIALPVLAGVVFLVSGPVAWKIGRRRWMLATPVAIATVWGLGVALAFTT